MARDDELFSWNKPKPRDDGAGAFKPSTAATLQTGVQDTGNFRTDIRQVGSTTVTAHTNQGMPWIESYTPGYKLTNEACPRSDWGFVDTTNSAEASAYLGDDPVMGPGAINKLVDAEGNRKVAKLVKNDADQKNLLSAMLPSLYTGAMRWVMQIMQGTGYKNLTATPMVYYDQLLGLALPLVTATWSKTCGIFIGETTGGKVTRWMVEISSSGVYRVPIKFCANLPSNWEASQSAALLENPSTWAAAHREVAKYWTVTDIAWGAAVKIADAAEVPMYTGHAGLYGNCGWAFTKLGHSAVNTAVRPDPTDATGRRKMCALFRMTISQDADGAPNGVSCVEAEADYLMNPKRDDINATENSAILQVASLGPGMCTTYSCWPGFSNFGSVTSTNTPVFAYYDASDSLQVARYTYSGNISSTPESSGSDTLTTYSEPCQTFGYMADTAGGGYAGVRVNVPGSWMSRTKATVATPLFSSAAMSSGAQGYTSARTEGYYALDGPSGTLLDSNWSISYAAYNVSTTICGDDVRHISRHVLWYTGWRVRVAGQGWTKHTTTSSETQNNYDCLILHGYDRTSYVHFRYEGYANRSKVRSQVGIAVARGSGYPELDQGTGTYAPLNLGSLSYTNVEYWGCEDAYLSTFWEHDGSMYSDCTGDIAAYDLTGVGFGPFPAVTQYDPDEFTDAVQMKVVVGSNVYTLDGDQFLTDGNSVTELYLGDSFFYYTACCSGFSPARAVYDTYLNATSVGAGFGYPACTGRLHAFVGVF